MSNTLLEGEALILYMVKRFGYTREEAERSIPKED